MFNKRKTLRESIATSIYSNLLNEGLSSVYKEDGMKLPSIADRKKLGKFLGMSDADVATIGTAAGNNKLEDAIKKAGGPKKATEKMKAGPAAGDTDAQQKGKEGEKPAEPPPGEKIEPKKDDAPKEKMRWVVYKGNKPLTKETGKLRVSERRFLRDKNEKYPSDWLLNPKHAAHDEKQNRQPTDYIDAIYIWDFDGELTFESLKTASVKFYIGREGMFSGADDWSKSLRKLGAGKGQRGYAPFWLACYMISKTADLEWREVPVKEKKK